MLLTSSLYKADLIVCSFLFFFLSGDICLWSSRQISGSSRERALYLLHDSRDSSCVLKPGETDTLMNVIQLWMPHYVWHNLLHHCEVVFFWSSGIMAWMLFTFVNRVLCSCTWGRQWCGIFYFHCQTA